MSTTWYNLLDPKNHAKPKKKKPKPKVNPFFVGQPRVFTQRLKETDLRSCKPGDKVFIRINSIYSEGPYLFKKDGRLVTPDVEILIEQEKGFKKKTLYGREFKLLHGTVMKEK